MILKIGTYNIAHGAFADLDMSLLGKDIKEAGLDIVGLQEVDRNTARVFGRDTLSELQKASGLGYRRYCKTIDLQGGVYGHAMLSRFPLLSYRRLLLPMLEGGKDTEPRCVALATLSVEGKPFTFANTHLCWGAPAAREAQFALLQSTLSAPYILTGDFNITDFSEYEVLTDAARVNRKEAPIYSFHGFDKGPHQPIDNVIFTPEFRLVDVALQDVRHSDHYMLTATLEF